MPLPTEKYLAELRKDLSFKVDLCGQDLTFKTTWGLFSPKAIDEGTTLLLEYVDIHESDDCMDLGCGYGPIGVTLAKLAPKGQTLMVDNNFIAVNYSNKNAKINQTDNAEAILSHGFSHVGDRKFDVIISNLPAKVGKEMWHLYFYDAHAHLKPGGRLYMVTINGLRQFIKRNFNDIFGNYTKLKQGKTYTVAMTVKK